MKKTSLCKTAHHVFYQGVPINNYQLLAEAKVKLNFTTDSGIGSKATLGLIVLQTDETIESEFAKVLPHHGVALYHSRIPMCNEVNSDTLKQMQIDIPNSAALLPPALSFDVIGYGCTSGATIIGSETVRDAVQKAHPEAQVTNPITAIIAACEALNAKKLGFLTPYVPEVSAKMREKLEASGCNVVAFGSFEESEDCVVAKISEASILAAIESVAAQSECDAIVVSCTSLRTTGLVEEAEARIGKPIISSNLAMAWHMMKLANLSHNPSEFGELFNLSLRK
jgi:maleate isomerase